MGYETGIFLDKVLGELHVEASFGMVIVQNYNELNPPLRMEPEEARKLANAIYFALQYFDSD